VQHQIAGYQPGTAMTLPIDRGERSGTSVAEALHDYRLAAVVLLIRQT